MLGPSVHHLGPAASGITAREADSTWGGRAAGRTLRERSALGGGSSPGGGRGVVSRARRGPGSLVIADAVEDRHRGGLKHLQAMGPAGLSCSPATACHRMAPLCCHRMAPYAAIAWPPYAAIACSWCCWCWLHLSPWDAMQPTRRSPSSDANAYPS